MSAPSDAVERARSYRFKKVSARRLTRGEGAAGEPRGSREWADWRARRVAAAFNVPDRLLLTGTLEPRRTDLEQVVRARLANDAASVLARGPLQGPLP